MNIEQRIEYFQGMAVSFANQRAKAEKTNSDASSFYDLHNSIFIVGMHILEELQKMQHHIKSLTEFCQDKAKTCKWCEVSDCVYKTDCGMTFTTVSSDIGKTINYCENCGGKIEIVEVKK